MTEPADRYPVYAHPRYMPQYLYWLGWCRVEAWGSETGARRVTFPYDEEHGRTGEEMQTVVEALLVLEHEVRIGFCPSHRGSRDRVILRNGWSRKFTCHMPPEVLS